VMEPTQTIAAFRAVVHANGARQGRSRHAHSSNHCIRVMTILLLSTEYLDASLVLQALIVALRDRRPPLVVVKQDHGPPEQRRL
jgi:hypothetical protein